MGGPSTKHGGPRKSPKEVITKFINTAILKAEVCTAGIEPVHFQLAVYKTIAREMGWTELVNRIDRALQPTKGQS